MDTPALETFILNPDVPEEAELIAAHESMGVISALDIAGVAAEESFLSETSLDARKKAILKKAQERAKMYGHMVEDHGHMEFIKPKIITNGVESHWHFFETGLYFEEYVRNSFIYLGRVDESTFLKLFFYNEFRTDLHMLPDVIPLFNALKDTKATTQSLCYTNLGPIATLIALACNEMVIGDYGSVCFTYPDFRNWGKFEIFKESLDFMYEKFITRGIITREEKARLVDDPNAIVKLYSKELKMRTGQ